MSKWIYPRVVFLSMALGGIILMSNSCMLLPKHRDLHGKAVPLEKLRQMSPLKLEKAPEEKRPIIDINETPPPTLELSLERCRAMALQNNLELRATLINPTIAAERFSEERARFEAAFTARASKSKTDRPFIDTNSANLGTKVDQESLSVGLSQPLVSGGTASVDLSDTESNTNAAGSAAVIFQGASSFSYSQPLLRNAGTRTLTYGIRLASYQRQITDAQTKLAVMSVLANVDRVYWRLYAARQALEVRRQQYELAQNQLEQAQRFVDSGERAQIEILRAEAGVAASLESIIIAENSLRDRQRELKRVINHKNLEMQTETTITPSTEPVPYRYAIDSDQLVLTAMENRMEILVLELQILEDLDTVDLRKNATLPLISFDYRYNVNAFGATRGDSYATLERNQFANHFFGLNAQIPVGNRAAKSRLRQARLQRFQRLSTKKNREGLITLEVLNAGDQLEANWQRILASRQNVIVQGRLYEAERRQFELGSRTSTEVFDAQTNLADAQLSELSALGEYQIALVDLAYATGTLLGSANVEWEPINPSRN